MANIWDAALRDLEEKVRTDTFDFWFTSIEFGRHQDGTVHLVVDDEFFRAWIEENYLDLIEDSLTTVAGEPTRVEIAVEGGDESDDKDPEDQQVQLVEETDDRVAARVGRIDDDDGEANDTSDPESARTSAPTPSSEPAAEPTPDEGPTDEQHRERVLEAGLNPRYTFDEFVVGSSNQFVHAACVAVANKPAESYNPLFIFGGVGLGKTHLLQAVGNRLLRNNPNLRVANLSSEDFMNQVITSIRQEKMNEFRTEFRNRCDVLLIDDIQTIAGKDATQKEFFHTFNALYNSGKQIVITSDQPPQELPGVEERLASRFAWGLCADIQSPEMETRVAILEKKAAADDIELEDEVAIMLAKNIRSNVRELEGTLVRLSAQAKLTEQPITVEMAEDMLERMNIDHEVEVGVDKIIRATAEHFDITPTDIKGSRRTRAISKPRQYAMYLARKHTDHSYPELGRKFGGKDHTTVLAACQKLEDLVEEDSEIADLMDELETEIFG
jgi:chromosomal replication initiator protein